MVGYFLVQYYNPSRDGIQIDRLFTFSILFQEIKHEPSNGDNESLSSIGLASNNPILANITDYLIEEASAEEEELLGKNNDLEDGEEGEDGNSVTRDEELLKVNYTVNLISVGPIFIFSQTQLRDLQFCSVFRYSIDCCFTCEQFTQWIITITRNIQMKMRCRTVVALCTQEEFLQ